MRAFILLTVWLVCGALPLAAAPGESTKVAKKRTPSGRSAGQGCPEESARLQPARAAVAVESQGTEAPSEGSGIIQDAWQAVHQRDYRRAIALFRQARLQGAREASVLLGLGTAYMRIWRDAEAAGCLRAALARDSYAADAHLLLGDLAFRADDMATARRHYEQAHNLDPNDILARDRLAAFDRAADAESGMERLQTTRFIVKYRPAQRRWAQRALHRLEHVADPVRGLLAYDIGVPLVVIVHADDQYRLYSDGPSWSAGFFDGRLHLAGRTVAGSDAQADAALAHEFSHAALHRLTEGRLPAWLDEGLALYAEGRSTPWPSPLVLEREAELRPLHAMHESFADLPRRDAALLYAESYDATVFLIQRHGRGVIRRLVETTRTMPFAQAFESAAGEPYHVFDAAWVAAERAHVSDERRHR